MLSQGIMVSDTQNSFSFLNSPELYAFLVSHLDDGA